jgi:epoxyqueuosine reductase
MITIDDILNEYLIPSERFIRGFADLRGLLPEKFNRYSFGISIGMRLEDSIVNEISEGPTQKYFDHYKEINSELARITGRIVEDLAKIETEALAIAPSVPTSELDSVYFDTLRTDFPHKMAATRAGLGWIGKTDLLISPVFGPRLRLVTILLKDYHGKTGKPINKSKCGNCSVCVDNCPAGAANGKKWDITVDRDEFYDAWKCRDKCAEFGKERLSSDARVCGICVETCPVGK